MMRMHFRARNLFNLALLPVIFSAAELTAQTFTVTEIHFRGAAAFNEDELSGLLHSEADEDFDARLVKLDLILLTNFYRQNGFLTATVRDSLTIDTGGGFVVIFYMISEGQRYYYDRTELTGYNIFGRGFLMSLFSDLQKGEPFDEGMMKTARQNLENAYYNQGKPFVQINFDYHFESDTLVVVDCTIRENKTVYIKEMEYLGLKLVQEFIVRRELEIGKGEIYNREKLAKSQRNLYRTGLFEYIRFELKPIPQDSSQAILQIQVQERDPWWIGASLGFTYEDEESYGNKLELSLEGGHRNLWGTARSISLHVVPSFAYDVETRSILNPDNHITLVFVEPWIGYTRTPGVFMTSYHLYRPQNSADFDVLRFNFGVSRELTEMTDLRGTLEAKLVTTMGEGSIDTTLVEDVSRDQVYTVLINGKRDSRNNFFNPTDGALTDASASYSYSLGREDNGERNHISYLTFIAAWRRFQPVRWNLFKRREQMTLATRLKAGVITEIGLTKDIPISDLFFAGGATTVRGYDEQLLGPTTLDADGYKDQAIGGKLIFLANAEIRIPIFWLIVGELFLDVGNVWREVRDFQPKEIKFATGVGLVVLTPLGPIRFDYGIKLNPDSIDRQRNAFHFGLYFAF
jgi:outer membrane protein insertion porin family